MVTNTGTLVN